MPAPFSYDTGRSEFTNEGVLPYYMVWDVDHSDVVAATDTVTLVVPANLYILDVGIIVNEAWEGGGSEIVDVGDGSDADGWIDNTDQDIAVLNSVSRSTGSANALANGAYSTLPQTIVLTFANLTYTAGKLKVFAQVLDLSGSWRESFTG